MRGVDYRTANGIGIKLLIARNFQSQRAYIQGQGRVGRYMEDCERFMLAGIDSVDEKAYIEICSRLL